MVLGQLAGPANDVKYTASHWPASFDAANQQLCDDRIWLCLTLNGGAGSTVSACSLAANSCGID
jgi:hypothetical protein